MNHGLLASTKRNLTDRYVQSPGKARNFRGLAVRTDSLDNCEEIPWIMITNCLEVAPRIKIALGGIRILYRGGDPESAGCIKVKIHRLSNERLRKHELNLKSIGQLEFCLLLFCSESIRRGDQHRMKGRDAGNQDD